MNVKECIRIGSTTVLAIISAGPALSQSLDEPEYGDMEVITVTSQRRAESIQDVPISVTALSQADLAANSIDSIQDAVQFVPGLSGKTQGLLTPVFAVRGIATQSFSSGGENSIGIFWDDAYAGRVNSQNLAFFDLERVEVLKGPQGSLFGRNASTGAISITTNRAGAGAGSYVRVEGGSFGMFEGDAAFEMPLGASSGFRIAAFGRTMDGYDDNVVTGRSLPSGETLSIRGSAYWDPTGPFSSELILTWQDDDVLGIPRENRSPFLASVAGLPADPFDGRFANNVEYTEDRSIFLAALHADYDLRPGLSVETVSQYSQTDATLDTDTDASALPIFNAQFNGYDAKAYGQDIRLVGANNRFDWFVGANYYIEDIADDIRVVFDETTVLGSFPIPGAGGQLFCEEPVQTIAFGQACGTAAERITSAGDYTSWSVYADGVLAMTDRLSLTAGLRYSEDNKEFRYETTPEAGLPSLIGPVVLVSTPDGEVELERTFADFQPRFVVDYMWTDDILTYASISRGYKAGGFDPSQVAASTVFDAEENWSYEAGFKSQFANDRIRLNVAAFLSDYDGFQIQTVRDGLTSTTNAPVETKGVEVELDTQFSPSFRLGLSGAYTDATFETLVTDEGDFSGNRLTFAPELTAAAVADWNVGRIGGGDLSVRGSLTYESEQFLSEVNAPDQAQDGFSLVNLRVTYQTDYGFRVSGVAENLFDTEYLVLADDFGFGTVVARGMPRALSIEIAKEL